MQSYLQQNAQVLATKRRLLGLYRISMQRKCFILACTTPPAFCAKKNTTRIDYLRASEQLVSKKGCYSVKINTKYFTF